MRNTLRQRRKPKRDSIDKLRARVWFESVVFFSGGMTKQQLWKDIGFSRSAWFNFPKGTVPTERIVNAVETKYPETRQILNANLWTILQGKKVSESEIQEEFMYFNSHFSANYPLQNLEFWSENSGIDFPHVLIKMGQVLATDDDRGTHLQTIISLMSLVENSDVEIWNELCGLYRTFFPDFATQIHWSFKDEVFDAIDDYVRLREKRGIRTIEAPSDDWSWRDRKLEIISVLDEHYVVYLYLHFYENKNSSMLMPRGVIENISSRLSFKICCNEKLMFHSWNLWEPAVILLLKILNERMIDNRNVTADFFIAFLEQENFFKPYDQELFIYEYLMYIAKDIKLRLDLDLINDTIKIIAVRSEY